MQLVLADTLMARGELAEAESLYRESLRVRELSSGDPQAYPADARAKLAACLEAQGRIEKVQDARGRLEDKCARGSRAATPLVRHSFLAPAPAGIRSREALERNPTSCRDEIGTSSQPGGFSL